MFYNHNIRNIINNFLNEEKKNNNSQFVIDVITGILNNQKVFIKETVNLDMTLDEKKIFLFNLTNLMDIMYKIYISLIFPKIIEKLSEESKLTIRKIELNKTVQEEIGLIELKQDVFRYLILCYEIINSTFH